MKYSYTQYFIFLFLLHYSHSISAQSNQVTISGFIRDVSSGEMLLGTNVLLYRDTIDLKLPPYRGTSSNNHGFFAIPKLSKGKYFLVNFDIDFFWFNLIGFWNRNV